MARGQKLISAKDFKEALSQLDDNAIITFDIRATDGSTCIMLAEFSSMGTRFGIVRLTNSAIISFIIQDSTFMEVEKNNSLIRNIEFPMLRINPPSNMSAMDAKYIGGIDPVEDYWNPVPMPAEEYEFERLRADAEELPAEQKDHLYFAGADLYSAGDMFQIYLYEKNFWTGATKCIWNKKIMRDSFQEYCKILKAYYTNIEIYG